MTLQHDHEIELNSGVKGLINLLCAAYIKPLLLFFPTVAPQASPRVSYTPLQGTSYMLPQHTSMYSTTSLGTFTGAQPM